ncbi:unnamed protein product, partial [Mesorhabditis belari]|uniref:Uncharacterized protein n=1 Tax=Mesorhabditis belari TaxID=2138241 RepID=A0AAF3J1B0_9BILA
MASKRLTRLFLVCLIAFSMAISDGGDDDDQVEKASIGVERSGRLRRGICNLSCSCGWGNCKIAPGYAGSTCCSSGYAWHCCQ